MQEAESAKAKAEEVTPEEVTNMLELVDTRTKEVD